jgi:DNA-directed RNA polymerase subunit RPC12/RpoP
MRLATTSKTIRCSKCGFKVIESTCDQDGHCVACQISKRLTDDSHRSDKVDGGDKS